MYYFKIVKAPTAILWMMYESHMNKMYVFVFFLLIFSLVWSDPNLRENFFDLIFFAQIRKHLATFESESEPEMFKVFLNFDCCLISPEY